MAELIYPESKLTGVDPGIYPDREDEEYASGPGISAGGIKRALKSPLHFVDKYVHPERHVRETSTKNLGKAFHYMLLEPEKFQECVAVLPKINRRTKAGKEEYTKFMEENEGKTIVKDEDMQPVIWMYESVSQNKNFMNSLRNAKYEQCGYWNDPETGLLCKLKTDVYKEVILNGLNTAIITDVKTAKDASYVAFSKAIANYDYQIQAAFYVDGMLALNPRIDQVRYLFAVIENQPPYACAVYKLEEEDIINGRRKVRYALNLLKRCIEAQDWPSYQTEILTITMPAWAKR